MVINNRALPDVPVNFDATRPESWPLWLSITEVMLVLRLSDSTIRQLHANGKLRGRKFGRQVRWHRDQVTGYAS